MSNLENDVARLERALTQGLNIDLAEYDDEDQAKARADLYAQDQIDAAKQSEVAATTAAQELAAAEGVDLAQVEGTGSEGKVTKADVVAVTEGGAA